MAGVGFLIAVVGGLIEFWPVIRSTGIDGLPISYSIWQEHDLCSTIFGALAASSCSTATILWFLGLLLLGGGVILFLRGALGYSERGDAPTTTGPHETRTSSGAEAMEALTSLKAMHDSGLISDVEYEAKRAEVIKRL